MADKLRDWMVSPAIRLAAYYLSAATILLILTWWFPWLRDLILPDTAGGGGIPDFGAPIASESLGGTFAQQVSRTGLLALLALLGALVFTAPMVWIYTVMHRQQGYDRSFVRMLITLPVVVAGVVQVVQGDLALAFALAGIVAAVRFRTTVKDLQNAVFAFAGIGIGLAAGTGAFALAGAISMVICALFYLAWHLNVGVIESRVEGVASGGTLAEALVPGESQKAVALGDKSAVRAIRPQDLASLTGHAERLADFVRADALRKKKKYRELLLVYTNKPDEARTTTEAILEKHSNRWVEVDQIHLNGDNPVEVVEYLVRLKKDVKIGNMTDQLRSGNGDPIMAVELKPVTGLRKQLT